MLNMKRAVDFQKNICKGISTQNHNNNFSKNNNPGTYGKSLLIQTTICFDHEVAIGRRQLCEEPKCDVGYQYWFNSECSFLRIMWHKIPKQ
jgi:hypothetical protein